jgi:MFS family permease
MIVSIGFMARFVSRVPIGLFSDRFSRKRLFSFGAICVASSFLVLYLSVSLLHITASQVLTALAFTTVFPIGMTIAAEMSQDSSGTGVAAFASASSAAGLAAPLVCSVLLLSMPIRATYLVAALIGLAGVASSVLLPKGHTVRKSFEVRSSLQNVFANREVQLVSSVQVFAALSDIAISTYFPLRASSEIGLSPSMIALLMSLFPLGMTLIRILLPRIFGRITAPKLLTVALAVYMISMLTIPLATEASLLALFIGVGGVAHGMIWPSASLHLSHSVDRRDLGLANAVYGGVGDMVGIAAPVALSSIIASMGYSALYYTAFLFDLAGVVLMVFVTRD